MGGGNSACPIQNATKLTSSPSDEHAGGEDDPFAASTARRCGTAAMVARIMPVPYSELMASTPSVPIAIWAR